MQRLIKGCLAGLFVGFLSSAALAQPAAPAAPATTQAAPKKLQDSMPPGFDLVVVDGAVSVKAICQPNDIAWVKAGLKDVKPPKAPKPEDVAANNAPRDPNPLDMLDKLAEKRATWVSQIAGDLAIGEKDANGVLDDKIIPQLKKIDKLNLPIFYMITSQDALRTLCRDKKWGEPKFHFNPTAGPDGMVFIDDSLTISVDKPMDDQLLVALYNPKEDEKDRVKALTKRIEDLQKGLRDNVNRMAVPSTFAAFSNWIYETQFKPLNLKREQNWLNVGITSVLSSKYAALVTGVNRAQFLNDLLAVNQQVNQLINWQTVDLLKPLDPDAKDKNDKPIMNPLMKPLYEDAMRRKSIVVVLRLLDNAGDSGIPNVLKAVREKKPADNEALVKVIKEATKYDLTKDLQPW